MKSHFIKHSYIRIIDIHYQNLCMSVRRYSKVWKYFFISIELLKLLYV